MAQVGSIKLVGATNDISQNGQGPPASKISHPKEDATKSLEQVRQQNPNLADRSIPEPDARVDDDDDDVQLVLSVPRRRKKKRRKFIFSNSLLGQYQETHSFPKETKEETKTNDISARRKSTSVVQRLESCHLGEKEAGQRRGSLPAVPMSINTPIQQLTWTHEPNYNHHQFPAFPMSIPWWDDSTTTLSHGQLSSSNWVPWQQEDIAGKKRKFEGGWEDNGLRKQYRQSTQISPRSNPVSMISSRFNSQQQPNAGMAGTFDRHMSDHSTNMTWPTFDWEPYRIVNPQYVSPYTPSSMAMDITDSDNGSMSQQQPSFQGWAQHTGMFSHEFDPDQGNCDVFSPNHSPVPQPMASPARYSMQQCSPSSPLQQPMSVSRSQTPQPSMPSPNCIMTAPEPHFEVSAVPAPGNTTPTPATPAAAQPNIRAPKSSDVLRRPSLYKIPAWPPTLSAPAHDSSPASPVVPPATVNSNAINPDSNRRTTLHVTANSTSAHQLPNGAQNTRTTTNAGTVKRVNEPVSPSPSSPTPRDKPMTTCTEEFQIPRARAGRKHSPNLIVDIAETCQEVFPFVVVAERHGIPLQKVFDTFSAIIQLPLLRNADDRRRHGSLGKRRMKEYRDARKAMERAQEAERKAEMRAMRARVDEAARKSQGGPATGNVSPSTNGNGLLKEAILNRAGKIQGGGTA